MFKDFEQVSKETGTGSAPTAGLGDFGLGGLGGAEGGDETFMKLLNGFAKDLMTDDADTNNAAMDKILNQF